MVNKIIQENEISFTLDLQKNLVINPLEELVGNGLASKVGDTYTMQISNIYFLDDLERDILELPSLYPFDIYIQPEGQITHPNFRYKYSFRSFAPNGEIFKVENIDGPFVTINGNEYLLNNEQYKLISSINQYNLLDLSKKTLNNNLISFKKIKELSEDTAIILDKYLSSKNVVTPTHIKINLNYDGGILELTPSIEGVDESSFTKSFDRSSEVNNIYPLIKNNEKTHILITPEQKSELEKIKKEYRKVTDKEKIKEIIDKPAAIFDTDVIDVSEFYSDRVLEIGVYHPKVYPFVSPYKSQWIPGFEIKNNRGETSHVFIKSEAELSDFKDKIEDAKCTNKKSINYNGVDIPIEEAENIKKTALAQLEKKEAVTESGEGSIEKVSAGRKVLIIKENTDELAYKEISISYEQPQNLSLFVDDYLNPVIKLKKHQIQGVAWLQDLYIKNLKGCLLADDMGLGKTLQVLYLIDWHYRTYPESNKPYLIVAPVSLLENWKNEYERFFTLPRLDVLIATGILNTPSQKLIDKLSEKRIILTSYETLRRGQFNFCAVDFAITILDEAQKVKTPGALVTNAVKALKSDFKVAMTGTPVENSFVDLWCISDFAIPGLLGDAKNFAKKYQAPLKDIKTDVTALGNSIRNEIGGYFMRRLKSDIADDLTSKTELFLKKQMPDIQKQYYNSVVNSINSDTEDGGRSKMLEHILRLRNIVDHPFLGTQRIDDYSATELINSSAKLMLTIELLDKIRSKNEKAIIFTERKEMQRLLQFVIYNKYGISPRIINGDVPSISKGNEILSRQQTIDYFQSQEGFNVIIMSPIAAGMGLNVVAANHVIHYSRHWNPAKEMQATDRAYRIGQTKDVFVYYPLSVDDEFETFDIVLNNLLSRKMSLASSTLYPSEMIEVSQQDLYHNLFGKTKSDGEIIITMGNISTIDDLLFEALTAVYFEKSGYDVILTKKTGDKGVDVLAMNQTGNFAIQCKHSRNPVGNSCISEVVSGSNYYASIYNQSFIPMAFTNSNFTNSAKELAAANKVKLYDGKDILNELDKMKITYSEVLRMEDRRNC